MTKQENKDRAIKHLTVFDLRDKIYEECGGTYPFLQCQIDAQKYVYESPEELFVNIQEWIDDKPLSDVKINGWSICDIIKYFEKVNVYISSMPYYV